MKCTNPDCKKGIIRRRANTNSDALWYEGHCPTCLGTGEITDPLSPSSGEGKSLGEIFDSAYRSKLSRSGVDYEEWMSLCKNERVAIEAGAQAVAAAACAEKDAEILALRAEVEEKELEISARVLSDEMKLDAVAKIIFDLRASQKELAEALAHCKSGLIQLADRNVHWYVDQASEALRRYEEGNK